MLWFVERLLCCYYESCSHMYVYECLLTGIMTKELKEELMVSCLRKRTRGTITCCWTVSGQRLGRVQGQKRM